MTDHACACGYVADSPADLADHLGEAFIADDDTAPDGQVHAEAARTGNSPGSRARHCLCGFIAPDGDRLDEHLLSVFTPEDGTGRDGNKHLTALPA